MMASLSYSSVDCYKFSEVEIYREERLGSGAYGVVCRAKCDQLPCAAKLLHPTFSMSGNWAVDKFIQECSFLASLKHPHIVQFLGVHTDPSTGQVALILELMDENLTNLLDRHVSMDQLIPFHLLINISHDVTLALQYLHSNAIIHRDLSSNNVLLLGECRAKLTDFGMSKLTTLNSTTPLSSLTQVPGCPVYMPPEAWIHPPVYSEKLDIFSFGVLLLQMITHNQPNPGPMESLISDERSPTGFMKLPVSEIERRSEDIASVKSDHPLKDTILECLIDKPEQRPTAKDLCQKIESLKNTSQYKESSKQKVQQQTLNVSNVPSSTDTGISDSMNLDSLEKKLTDKDLELQKLREKVASLEKENKNLKEQIKDKDEMIQNLNSKNTKQSRKEKEEKLQYDKSKNTLNSLCPEILQLISRDSDFRVFNLSYNIANGAVTFYPGSESIQQSMRVFLQLYQHIFNSGETRVEFFSVPRSFPVQFMNMCISTCSLSTTLGSFEYLEIPDVIKMISKTPSVHSSNTKLLSNILNLRMDLEGTQCSQKQVTLKKGDITEEDVSIIVSAANPGLTHHWGVSAAINIASHFEVQKHCNEYIAENGPLLDSESVAYTKAGGSLKCKGIIHVVGPFDVLITNESEVDASERNRAIKQMKSKIHKVLSKAEKLNATSIAIPAISTGSMGMLAAISAKGIMEGITTYKFGQSSCLNDIRVVILKDEIFHKFVEVFISYMGPSLPAKRQASNTSTTSSTGSNKSLTDTSLGQHCKQQ